MSREGRWRPRAARRVVLAAEVSGQRPVPERNGAQASRSNVTGKARRLILSGAERRRVCSAEMPCGSAEAGRGFDTTEGASSRSSIFSRQRRWLLNSEGTVERFWSFGETDPRAREQRTRPRLAVGAGADALVPGGDMGRQRLGRIA